MCTVPDWVFGKCFIVKKTTIIFIIIWYNVASWQQFQTLPIIVDIKYIQYYIVETQKFSMKQDILVIRSCSNHLYGNLLFISVLKYYLAIVQLYFVILNNDLTNLTINWTEVLCSYMYIYRDIFEHFNQVFVLYVQSYINHSILFTITLAVKCNNIVKSSHSMLKSTSKRKGLKFFKYNRWLTSWFFIRFVKQLKQFFFLKISIDTLDSTMGHPFLVDINWFSLKESQSSFYQQYKVNLEFSNTWKTNIYNNNDSTHFKNIIRECWKWHLIVSYHIYTFSRTIINPL